MAKRIFYIFILTLLAGILIFCIYMMTQYYQDFKKDVEQKENNPSDKATIINPVNEDGTPATPTPTQKPDLVTPTPTPIPTPTQAIDYSDQFGYTRISEDVLARITGKSLPEDADISIDDLRYVHVMHYGFDGEVHEGELIVNAAIAQDVVDIFKELFEAEYPIEKIRLIDEYDANDEASMEDNNSSAFCYRTIAETSTLSNHAKGLAIDINPLYNPYVYTRKDGTLFLQPENAEAYVDRDQEDSRFIKKDDICYNIFIAHGFTWGGDWDSKKDYQHFEKKIN